MVHPKPSPSGKGDRHRRWMRRGTAFSIVGTTGAEVKHIEKPTLALPLGELSPKVTERALQRLLNNHVHLNPQRFPSPSSLALGHLSHRERQGVPTKMKGGTMLRFHSMNGRAFSMVKRIDCYRMIPGVIQHQLQHQLQLQLQL